MRVTGRHWSLAFAGAVLLHGTVAAAILWTPDDTGARNAGQSGLNIGMATAGGQPGSAATAPAQSTETVEAVETATDAARPADAARPSPAQEVATQTPPTAAPAEPEAVEPTRTPTTPTAEAAAPGPVKSVDAEAPAPSSGPVPPKPATKPDSAKPAARDAPEPAETQSPDTVQAAKTTAPPEPKTESQPEPETKTAPEPETVQTAEPVTTAKAAPQTADKEVSGETVSTAGSQGQSGQQAKTETGNGTGQRSGGGSPGARQDYLARLQAWLARHKEYPRRARLRRQEGLIKLRFSFDQTGKVLEYEIVEGSGHALLDEAVIAMIERAQPLPPIPAEMNAKRLEMTVPIQFQLR